MYLVLRHVGGSRDSGTGCALVGVSRYNVTNVYFCIMFLYLSRINKFLPSFLPSILVHSLPRMALLRVAVLTSCAKPYCVRENKSRS